MKIKTLVTQFWKDYESREIYTALASMLEDKEGK